MTSASLAAENGLRILDGGTGSELRRRGVGLSRLCWSAEANLGHADLVNEIHNDYIRAGADIITANTFATNRFVLGAAGLDDRFEAINRAAIDAARRAASRADRAITVAASLSCLPPAFDAAAYPSPDTEYRAYAELAGFFAENGVDLILLEMMQQPAHAARACRAARQSGLPFWIGIACRPDRQSGRLVGFDAAGQSTAELLDTVLGFEPRGIAVMHSPVDAIGPALAEIGKRWPGPVGAYAETPYAEGDRLTPDRAITPDGYALRAREWSSLGAVLVGGCCGTTPEHIAALAGLRGD